MGRTAAAGAAAAGWFKPELRTKDYHTSGDAYDDSRYVELAEGWNVEPSASDEYSTLVKRAAQHKWTHLRLLADFMQIGRIPRVWGDANVPVIPTDKSPKGIKELEDRWGRSNIRILDYPAADDDAVREHEIISVHGDGLKANEIKAHLDVPTIQGGPSPSPPAFRLYVVEDLSRNVIEALGSKFSISPDFFRAHIVDYAWYNVRDRWREPQPLEVVRGARDWFQIRFVTTRYFASREQPKGTKGTTGQQQSAGGCFEGALKEAKEFNILRRPDDDQSRGWWDSEEAVVALTRAKATFWLKPKDVEGETGIGVLLLDPSVSQGLPLWRGHRNFHPVPSTLEALNQDISAWQTPTYESPSSFFDDFIYWARHPEGFFPPSANTPRSAPARAPPSTSPSPRRAEHFPVQTLLHLIVAEWLTLCDYIKTRLNQIELETVDPENFSEDKKVDLALKKLHMWRRFIPLYREMVSETLLDVFRFPCYAVSSSTSTAGDGSAGICPVSTSCRSSSRGAASSTAVEGDHAAPAPRRGNASSSIKSYEQDLKLVLAYLEEHQQRIDRLTSVVTAVMAVNDTRRANADARNIGRLTWLATFFLPFSVVSGIFSMQKLEDMSGETIGVYFATTLPVAIVAVVFAWAFPAPLFLAWLGRFMGDGVRRR